MLDEHRLAPGAGFAEHGHANMETLGWVLQGALAHRDSTGTGGMIRPGGLQRISAGHGIRHSERNAQDVLPVHFLQIWIQPDRSNRNPGDAHCRFDAAALAGGWTLLAAAPAAEAGEAVLPLHAAARVHAWCPHAPAQRPVATRAPQAWLQVTRDGARINGSTRWPATAWPCARNRICR